MPRPQTGWPAERYPLPLSDTAVVIRNPHHPSGKAKPSGVSRVGTTLGKYRLLNFLGQGGMGVVYEGEDTVLQRRVAIKLLHDNVIADAQVRQRFLNEARAAARLNHPHAVTVYEIGCDAAIYYIAMEWARGGSIQDHLDIKGPLPWLEATRVVADACRGLAAAHAAGLVHRDIKPANIMRSETGLVKLSDFGLACVVGQSTTASTAVGSAAGTPYFMSPEQCRNDPLDERSDLYSLGATYYALLAGRPPYLADKPMGVMFAHCSQEIPNPQTAVPDLPDACAAIIRRAMAKYPADRYDSAGAMLADLEQAWAAFSQTPGWQGNRETMAPRQPLEQELSPSRFGRWSPANSKRAGAFRAAKLILAGVAGVVLLVAGALWLRSWGPAAENRLSAPAFPAPPAPVPLAKVERGPTAPTPAPWRTKIPHDGLALSLGQPVQAVVFSPDGKWLAAACGGGEGGVRIWDLDRLEPHTELWPGRRFSALTFSPDSQLLVAGGQPFEGQGLRLWSVRKGGQRALPTENIVRSVAFDSTGRLLAAGLEQQPPGSPACVKLWRGVTGREILNLGDHSGWVATVLFSRDGKTLLSVGKDGDVRLWEVANGMLRGKLSTGIAVAGMALSPDGHTLAIVGSNLLQFWNLTKGAQDDTRRIVGQLQCVAYRREGRLLATGNQSGLVTLWNPATHEETQNLRGHTQAVTGLSFSPDGQLLATAGQDGSVRLWNVGPGGRVGDRKP